MNGNVFIGIVFVVKPDMLRCFRMGFEMVSALHHQVLRRVAVGLQTLDSILKQLHGTFLISHGPVRDIAIAIIEMTPANLAAIGACQGTRWASPARHRATERLYQCQNRAKSGRSARYDQMGRAGNQSSFFAQIARKSPCQPRGCAQSLHRNQKFVG